MAVFNGACSWNDTFGGRRRGDGRWIDSGIAATRTMYLEHIAGTARQFQKGIDINHMMAEILAKANGVCKGKGGSMHIADPDIHYFGADGILGTSAVMCCGTALKIKKKKEENRISVVFFGDGSSNEGAVFEAFNLASVWNLPVLFICVNNTYGMSTPIARL